jgi:membrane-associated phospholipid phosphatase
MLTHIPRARSSAQCRDRSSLSRRRNRRWTLESLEERRLLSTGADAFAHLSAGGSSAGSPGYRPADVDRDGVIDREDLRLARRDLGAAMTVRPMTVSVALARSSDPDGNGVVTSPHFQLAGRTAPGAHVIAMVDGRKAGTDRADARGIYHLHLTVRTGMVEVQVIAADAGGRRVMAAPMSVMRGDVIIAWNRTALEAARVDMTAVGLLSRDMAMVSAAVYDAVNAIDHIGAAYHFALDAKPGSSPEAAASQAAYDTLLALYPSQKALFDVTLAQTLGSIDNGSAKAHGREVGRAAARAILDWRANDGSSVMMTYTPGTASGQWQPTPPDYQTALEPMWGQVTPFGVPNAMSFLPPPPPPMNSPEYTAAFNQVESLGAVNSTTRTPEETQIGLFWAYDLPGVMGPPPIHYDQIAEEIALQQHNTFDQNARMFALANIAMADAGIVAWDTKYTDNFWRPVTAIRGAGSDGNPDTVADPNWMPLGAPGEGVVPNYTPPFPAYISGHATFGAALFQTLADFYHTDNVTFTLTSDEMPGVTRTYSSFSAAAEENAISRIYLGIHWSFDATEGVATGDSIGNYVFSHVMSA